MNTPFTFFRRNSQMLMVATVILSMIAFTLSDMISSQGSQFVLLGLVTGGIVFAFAGVTTGRWLPYGIAGAVLGAACGWILPEVISPSGDYVRISKLGTFDNQRYTELQNKRNIANGFIVQAFEAAHGAGTARFAPTFQFYSDNVEDDLTFGELMRAEADSMGIVVTDVMVSDYINERTNEKLTATQFAEIRNSLNPRGASITEAELFDCLRGEIKALIAYQHLNPRFSSTPQGPEVHYELFKRTKVTERLNTVRLDVDDFVGEIEEPSEAEVASLFADYRLKFPGMDEPGSPGFRQQQRAKLAYLELGYKAVEKATTPPTDQEVEAYYNEKKDELYRKPPEPKADVENSAPDNGAVTPTTPDSATPAPETKPADESKPAAGAKPAEENKPVEEAKPPADEAKPAESQADAKPVEESKPAEPAANAQPADATEPAEEKKPAEEKPAGDCSPFESDEEKAAAATVAPAASSEPVVSAPQAEPAASTETTAPAAETPTVPAAETPAAETPAAETPAAAKPATPAEESTKPVFEIPKIEYRPLDEDMKSEIKDQLFDDKVRNAIAERMKAIKSDLKGLEKTRTKARKAIVDKDRDIESDVLYEELRGHSKSMLDGMKNLAEKHGCSFVETPMVTFLELYEGETYPIGAATDPSPNAFMPASENVAQQVFGSFPKVVSDDTNLFVQHQSVKNEYDLDGVAVYFAWWIVEFSDTHVPTLDAPGIHDQVVLAWKRIKARELVKKRADELAALVRAGLAKPEAERKDMMSLLEGQTILGKPDSAVVAVRPTQNFSWMEQAATPQMNFMQRPQLRRSAVNFADETGGSIRYAGDRFMKGVFEELESGAVGVVPSDDLSTYYVVEVAERSADDDILRQQFLTESKQFGLQNSSVASILNSTVAAPAALAWEREIWSKYGIDRDTLPEE